MKFKHPATWSWAIALMLAGCNHPQPAANQEAEAPIPTVTVLPVTVENMVGYVRVTGVLQTLPGREAVVTPAVGGVLDGLFVHYGQSVARGVPVAHITSQQAMGQIQQAEATLGQNKVQVAQAQANAIQQRAQTASSIFQAQANVRIAQAALAGAKATLTGDEAATHNAQHNLKRDQSLFDAGLIPEKDLETANLTLSTALATEEAQRETITGQEQTVEGQQQALAAARASALQDDVKRKDVEVAQQQVRNAAGALETANAQLQLYTLKSPISGIVTLLGATAGETVDTSTKVATIANLSNLQLRIDIPASQASQVHHGELVTFTVESMPDRSFSSHVDTVSHQLDPNTGTVAAYATVDNRNLQLRDDQIANIELTVERRDHATCIPESALLTDPDSGAKTVAVVDSDNVVHMDAVSAGLTVDGRIQIIKGVSPGQTIAVSGQYGLSDGSKVHSVPGNPNAPVPSDTHVGGTNGA